MQKLKYYALPILAGFLIGTSYIPLPAWSLFFCLVPLFIFWMNAKTLFECFFAGWLTQFFLNLIGFHWIYYLAAEFGHFPGWLAGLTLLAFAATAHLYFPVAGMIWFYLHKKFELKTNSSLILMLAIFALLQKYFLVLFPWHFGYEWYFSKYQAYQLADLIGFEGLNIIAIFSSSLFTIAYFSRLESPKKFWAIGLSPIVMVLVLNFLGKLHFNSIPTPDRHLKALTIQANIGNSEKIYAERGRGFQDFIMNKFISQSDEAIKSNPGTEFVIWPESGFADHLDNFFQNEPRNIFMRQFASRNKINLFTGAYHEDHKTRAIYNSIFLIEKDGIIRQEPYDKSILLAFGEYVPFSKYYPKVLKWLDLSEFGRGTGPHLFFLNEIKFGPQICYEGLYAKISRDLSTLGAEVFINVTNDSWYGTWFEPYQHLYMTAARAVEFRRPLIRATNTGITTVVLASGEFLEKSPTLKEWSHLYDVPFMKDPKPTLYEKLFYFWDILLSSIIVYILASSRIGRRRARI